MNPSRRDFLKASSAIAAALGFRVPELFAAGDRGDITKRPAVVWLQAQGCSGCSVSLLNTIFYATADRLLQATMSLKYHLTLMVAAGQEAVRAAQAARDAKDYILVVEGAIPTAAGGQYCYLWSGLTALEGVRQFQRNARFVVAVGTCAAFGGVPGGHPNPTGAKPLAEVLGRRQVINIPGCPAHPDWVVGTLAHLFNNHAPPPSDSLNRPRAYFGRRLHDLCPYRDNRKRSDGAQCLEDRGCKGERCRADCAKRKWNGGAVNAPGVSWCLAAGAPCLGCTEPGFPDGMSPFYGKAGKGNRHRRRKGWTG